MRPPLCNPYRPTMPAVLPWLASFGGNQPQNWIFPHAGGGRYPWPEPHEEEVSTMGRLGRLAVAAVAVPVAAKALRKAGQSMRARRGDSRMGTGLQKAASGLEVISGRRRP